MLFLSLTGRHSRCLMAGEKRFLWLLVCHFVGNSLLTNDGVYRITPGNSERSIYPCLAKRDQSVAILTSNYLNCIFCILIKSSQKMAYIVYIMYMKLISHKFLNSKNNFIFYLDHLSLYSGSAAWLPVPCLDGDEIAKLPPSYCVIHYQAFEVAGFMSKVFLEVRSKINCETMFSVHIHYWL